MEESPVKQRRPVTVRELEHVVIRFAGDSGDGMQLTGSQFTNTAAIIGNDISTLPDYPAEIRAPAGTLAGVSGFQVHLSDSDIFTPGDSPDVLIAMNPAALKVSLSDLEPGASIIVNTDAFTTANLAKAGYESNPLTDGSLKNFRVYEVPVTTLNRNAVQDVEGLGTKEIDRSQNFFALGLVYWAYDRPLSNTIEWIEKKFAKRPEIVDANVRALRAGFYFGDTTEAFQARYRIKPATLRPGTYRKVSGNEALAMGLVTAAVKANKTLFYGTYPITPASDILHALAPLRHFDVLTYQAEDEIAAMGATIGAAFGGALAVTGTSGPGIALKSEGMNLALMLELPMVIVNVQRGGPSTGLPTKVEQSDLLQVLFGRNGESPLPVIAPAAPAECFDFAYEAFSLALRAMTPVVLLSDGYLANSAEPWSIPDPDSIPPLAVEHPEGLNGDEVFMPYRRDPVTLARPWAIPGTPGLEHRVGGLEKSPEYGNVSYSPQDHQRMTDDRAAKVARLADIIPEQNVYGPERGDLLVVGWGSTYGAIHAAVTQAQAKGYAVAHAHIRYLNPFPRNLGYILQRYERILVPELNMGQLSLLLRGHFMRDVITLNKVQGRPFKISEISRKIEELFSGADK
ncbi:MAG: 2-oxoacid:acceptor oxidoreductase subunit alpha [Caldilineales bacterium]|nr:2-oxoacid:acceptor oxidoreductase subunit alpha [Caldilineales bacterium]